MWKVLGANRMLSRSYSYSFTQSDNLLTFPDQMT